MTGSDTKRTERAAAEEQFNPRTAVSEQLAPRRRWSTAFLIAGSALFGATAIALWNRRTIANMRAEFQAGSRIQPKPTKVTTEDEIV